MYNLRSLRAFVKIYYLLLVKNIDVVKTRLLFVFSLLVITNVPAFAQIPTSTPQITATPKPTATSLPSPSKSTTPISKFADDLEALDKSLTTIAFSLAKAVVSLLSLLLLYRLVSLIVYRSSQLIIDNFSNATGVDELDKALLGLGQIAREMLVQEMKGVRQQVKKHIKGVGPEASTLPDKSPLPQLTPDQRLADLVASLKEFTPDQIDPILSLLQILFPPFGTKVTTILQSQGQEHNCLGITFEITNIEGRIASKLYTIWEPTDDTSANAQKDSSQQMLKDRYKALFRSAIRWVALELCRREMLTAVPWTYLGRRYNRYHAEVHNFFGALNQASVPTHAKFFYELAIDDFQQAIDLYPDWYQPYENLANVYSDLSREAQQHEEAAYWQGQAILQYEKALERCHKESKSIQRRIKVGKAIAELLTGNKKLVEKAKQEIENIEQNEDDASKENDRFFYNLACWYVLALRQKAEVADARIKACRYLAYALAKDSEQTWWNWASEDPDLEEIREDITELKSSLLKKLNEVPELPKLTGQEFTEQIAVVLKTVYFLK